MVKDRFGLADLVMVGDRGMITSARIDALRQHTQLGWLTCLRAPAIKMLAADDGPLQMSLFDTQDLAEIVHPDYPDERLIACRNPALAQERARKREDLLAATESLLAGVKSRVDAGRLQGPDAIGIAVGKVVNKYKMAKHFTIRIGGQSLSYQRDQARIDAEAVLDGIYVIRTSVTAGTLDAAGVVTAYKRLSHVERCFGQLFVGDDGGVGVGGHVSAVAVAAGLWRLAGVPRLGITVDTTRSSATLRAMRHRPSVPSDPSAGSTSCPATSASKARACWDCSSTFASFSAASSAVASPTSAETSVSLAAGSSQSMSGLPGRL